MGWPFRRRRAGAAWRPGVRYPAGAAVLLASAAAAWVMQAPSLPAPTGAFAVGTLSAPLPPQPRQQSAAFAAQLWYPAQHGDARAASTESVEIAWHGIRFGRRVVTAAVPGISPATRPGGFPLVVYVPEWGGARTGNTAMMQDLASQGFVVAAIDPASAPAIGQGMKFSSVEAFAATLRLAERLVRAQARDAVELLNRLQAAPGQAGPLAQLAGRIDFNRVGIFGFSFGGAVAAQACWTDPRFRAALDMDGWLFGDAAQAGIAQPFMILSDDTPLPGAVDLASPRANVRFTSELNLADSRRAAAIMARFGGVRVTILGARHGNFSDQPLIWPIRRMVGAGTVAPEKAFRLVSGYASAFFRKHLNGEDAPLLRAGAVPPDGVRLERWAAPDGS